MKFCIVDAQSRKYVADDDGNLQWISDLETAKLIASAMRANVYDAEAFAKDPVPEHHVPIFEGSKE